MSAIHCTGPAIPLLHVSAEMKVMAVHVVRYTPRTGSRTARLLEHAIAQLDPAPVVTDLATTLPPLFDTTRVDGYVARNYGGIEPAAETAAALAPMDRYVEQLRAADRIILATPMYNFGLPAAVKAWFDAVIQKDRTWTVRDGAYEGWLTGHRALLITTSSGQYEDGPGSYDLLTPTVRQLFGFMGFAGVDVVAGQGTAAPAEVVDRRMAQARAEIDRVIAAWKSEAPTSRAQPAR